MRTIIYACVPIEARKGFFKRVRINIDGMKVTSMEDAPNSFYHILCVHRPTIHYYNGVEIEISPPPHDSVTVVP